MFWNILYSINHYFSIAVGDGDPLSYHKKGIRISKVLGDQSSEILKFKAVLYYNWHYILIAFLSYKIQKIFLFYSRRPVGNWRPIKVPALLSLDEDRNFVSRSAICIWTMALRYLEHCRNTRDGNKSIRKGLQLS